jgi:LAGLIDADG-like domain
LAYETGVHLGDGCLQQFASYSYRYSISGSRKKEQAYYRCVLAPLLQDLYGVEPSVVESGSSIFLYVYSKELLEFKHRVMGMPIGPKKQLTSLPSYVTEAEDSWVGRFLRGLYDTDGCVKLRRTVAKDYPRISLVQAVEGVVRDVMDLLLARFHISSTIYCNTSFDKRRGKYSNSWFLDVNGHENFRLFLKQIGTSNPYVEARLVSLGLGTGRVVVPDPCGPASSQLGVDCVP